jgi:3-dehydro-scyllo-inosose hydrolase
VERRLPQADLINNHGHLWMLESAIQQFQKRYQLPGIFRVIDWHRAVREFFRTTEKGGKWDTNFVHADESETSLGLLLHPDMVDMATPSTPRASPTCPTATSTSRSTPSAGPAAGRRARVTSPSRSRPPRGRGRQIDPRLAQKAKRPVAAILKYLTLLNDQILEVFPAGTVPPVEEVTLRTAREMEPYLREPLSEGWKTVYALPLGSVGQS